MRAGPLGHLEEQTNDKNPSVPAERAEGQKQRQLSLDTEEGSGWGSFSTCHTYSLPEHCTYLWPRSRSPKAVPEMRDFNKELLPGEASEGGKQVRQERNLLRSAQQGWLQAVLRETLVGNLHHGASGITGKSLVSGCPRGMWISRYGQDGRQQSEGGPLKKICRCWPLWQSHTQARLGVGGAEGDPGVGVQRLATTVYYCVTLLWVFSSIRLQKDGSNESMTVATWMTSNWKAGGQKFWPVH